MKFSLPQWFTDEVKTGKLFSDIHIYGGLALAGWGGWQLSPAWTGIGLGCIFVILGVVASMPRKRRPE